jgi:hypothetical protein
MKSTLYDLEKHEVEQHLTWITRIARLAADFAKSKNLHMPGDRPDFESVAWHCRNSYHLSIITCENLI